MVASFNIPSLTLHPAILVLSITINYRQAICSILGCCPDANPPALRMIFDVMVAVKGG